MFLLSRLWFFFCWCWMLLSLFLLCAYACFRLAFSAFFSAFSILLFSSASAFFRSLSDRAFAIAFSTSPLGSSAICSRSCKRVLTSALF